MSEETNARLIYMANQIARNFAALGDTGAADATSNHITQFWDPRMKSIGIALIDEPDCGLSVTARGALARVAQSADQAG